MDDIGVAKVRLGPLRTFALAILAEAFIALSAILATTVTTGGGALPVGVNKLLGRFVFRLGLILVIGAGPDDAFWPQTGLAAADFPNLT